MSSCRRKQKRQRRDVVGSAENDAPVGTINGETTECFEDVDEWL